MCICVCVLVTFRTRIQTERHAARPASIVNISIIIRAWICKFCFVLMVNFVIFWDIVMTSRAPKNIKKKKNLICMNLQERGHTQRKLIGWKKYAEIPALTWYPADTRWYLRVGITVLFPIRVNIVIPSRVYQPAGITLRQGWHLY